MQISTIAIIGGLGKTGGRVAERLKERGATVRAASRSTTPRFDWDPSIAPGAIVVYRGKMFPEWNGQFLVTALKFELLSRLNQDDKGKITEQERMFDGKFGRLRDIAVAPDGALLITTDENNGALLRVSRAAD